VALHQLLSAPQYLEVQDYIVSGYGFTDERDHIYVVRRSDGKIMQKLAVPKAPQGFVIAEDGLLEVTLYPGTLRMFALRGWDGPKPTLVKAERPASGRVTGRR
jgi:hypothetical protein